MRMWLAAGAAFGMLVLAAIEAGAQAPAQVCRDSARAIGVARTVRIDTAAGPRFGQTSPDHVDLLRDREVVLTFDDGPVRGHTRAVLDALDAHCTKATFFMVGRMAIAEPLLVQEVYRRGHTVGTHSYSHANLLRISASKAQAEVELGVSAVSQALGRPVAPFFRFPYLAESKSMGIYVQWRSLGAFGIDVDSKDYRTHDSGQMQSNVLHQLARTGKGIILFHDIQASTSNGLLRLLDELKRGGYQVVHVEASAPASTIPSFDEIAARELSGKKAVAAASPLASHSVVWSMAPSAKREKERVAAPGTAKASLPIPAAAPVAAPAATTSPPPPPAPSPAPPLRGSSDDEWRSTVFSR